MEYNAEVHSLLCPKCRHGMEQVRHEDITIDRCTNCHGLWFDGDEAQRLKNLPGAEVLDTGNTKEGRKYDVQGDIRCPHCNKPMEKSAHWKQTHIWYEVCRDHGIFMDAGEFTDFKYDTLLDRLRGLIKGKRSS
jgi:Zn-finger nucleic acid-binding protein